MDAMSLSHPAQTVVVMKASQAGFTEAANNWIGYVIHHAPGPMMAVQPTVDLAKRFSKQRIDSLIEQSPAIREKVSPSRDRDSGNTILAKEFPGGILVMTGANSAPGLRSMPARYLFLDEVDSYPASAGNEGDPVELAIERTRTYGHRSKILMGSKPTERGKSKIEHEFETTNQQRYFVPCPFCNHMQWLQFERLRWTKGKPETAHYECAGCDQAISERHKTGMLADGEWRPTAESDNAQVIGFHISALYSPVGWMAWSQIAAQWEAADTDEKKRAFKNGVLGETWIESGEAPDWQRLYDRREVWHIGTVPKDGLFLTAGVDVQKDRLECSVWAWGRGLESWFVEHTVIDGGAESQTAWDALKAKLNARWKHENGGDLGILRMAIDTGYETSAVYTWARAMGWAQVSPVKGIEGFNKSSPVSGPTHLDATVAGRKIKRGVRLWTVAVSTFKTETYRFLRQNPPTDEAMAAGECYPAGYVHLPHGTDEEVIKQLVAEQLVTVKTRRGYQRLEWQKIRQRNESLDCRIYARAAAYIAGADRWGPDTWRDLEDQVAVSIEDQPPRPIRQGGRKQRSSGISIG
ncbi:MAG: hypothetical protein Dbin4_02795 [Alphaproteobacteria bacterium]|nr:hypothetical protein [Alphaproteobacteria bacterium]